MRVDFVPNSAKSTNCFGFEIQLWNPTEGSRPIRFSSALSQFPV